jgi:hypothetical protein
MNSRSFGKELLLERAAEVDAGFDPQVFAEMLRTLDRFADQDVPASDVGIVRRFFCEWADELQAR